MALLPPSTNGEYRGAAISAWFLALVSVLTIIPGCIHFFLPDGGAGIIGHIDLTTRADTIIALVSWYGAMQIPQGIGGLVIGLRYRTLAPLFLLLIVIERALTTFDGWFGKGSHGGHHPPEHYASIAIVVLALVFLALSLRTRADRSPARA